MNKCSIFVASVQDFLLQKNTLKLHLLPSMERWRALSI